MHGPRALCRALAAAGAQCLCSPVWDGSLHWDAVTSRARSGAGTVLAAGTGVGAAQCHPHTGGAGVSPAVPGPCFTLVPEVPPRSLSGALPWPRPQLSLPFPWGQGLSSLGGLRESQPGCPGEGCTASGSTLSSDSIFLYILYDMPKYFDGFNILYQPWKLVCC